MKPTELRIGNYVYYEHTTHIVSGVHGNKVYSWWVKDGQPVIEYEAKDISGTQVENPYIDVISQHEPIPLTEEWLVKFGFKITGQTPHPNNIWTVYGEECKFELEHIISFFLYDNKCFGTEVKYIHQLQNLYFALTGEELTFKQD